MKIIKFENFCVDFVGKHLIFGAFSKTVSMNKEMAILSWIQCFSQHIV